VLVTGSPQDAPQDVRPPTHTLRLTTGLVRDSLGNSSTGAVTFVASSQRADTTRTRLVDIRPTPAIDDSVATLSPNERIVVTLNQSAGPDLWLRLVDPSTASEFDYTWGTADGWSYRIEPSLPVGAESFLLRVHAGRLDDSLPTDSVVTRRFRRLRAGEVGEISGVVRPDTGNVVVHVFRADDPSHLVQATVGESGAFRATGLRPGRYVLRTFLDLDGNGRWTSASFPPYSRGEPIQWVTDSLEVRTRFETVLPDTVTFPGD
jgi:hypothetical protein